MNSLESGSPSFIALDAAVKNVKARQKHSKTNKNDA